MDNFIKISALLCALIYQMTTVSAQTVSKDFFGKTSDGIDTNVITLENSSGMEIKMTDYGATMLSVIVPDRNGVFKDVVLGFNTLKEYESQDRYYGATLGRFNARIEGGRFVLDGKEYRTTINEPNHNTTLHGGKNAFDRQVWKSKTYTSSGSSSVEFSHISPDGDNGFPGNLEVTLTVTLTNNNEIVFLYKATTDKPTPINLSNHIYWNLKGEGNGTVHDNILTINADKFTPHKKNFIPTGEILPVENTPFDFRQPHTIGERVDSDCTQLKYNKGYSHNYVLNRESEKELEFAIRVVEPETGRALEVYTTQPGLLLHTGNVLDGTDIGKSGKAYQRRSAIVIEPQHFCNSPNQKNFPNTILRPNKVFKEKCIWKFYSVR